MHVHPCFCPLIKATHLGADKLCACWGDAADEGRAGAQVLMVGRLIAAGISCAVFLMVSVPLVL